MKKIKILVDARCVGGEGQGMLTYLIGLYNAFHNHYNSKYELFFAGYDKKEMQASFPFIEDTHFIELPKVNRFILFWKIFPDIIEENEFDYAHFQYVTPFRKKCKYIVTTHDILFLDFPNEFSFSYRLKRKFLFKNSLLKSDIKLTVSNYSRERISKLFGISSDSIRITPNAVHSKFLEPYDKREVQKQVKNKFCFENYLLYVSRIEKRKNQKALLKAYEASDLASEGIQLVLIGNDTLGETDTLKEVARLKTKYPGMVHWQPHLDETDLLNVYRAARLFVYPSLAEGFGIPPIEAAAIGLKTLCSNKTAMRDFTFFDTNHFDPTDNNGFVSRLKKSIEQPLDETVVLRNQAFIKAYYSWEKAAKVIHQEIQANSDTVQLKQYNRQKLKRA